VRFRALTTTPKTTMSLDWMHLIHAELARLGADLSAASREGVLTPFKRHGVVYVDQAAVHFKVKMWASSSSSSSSSSSEAHEEGSTTGERDGVVCEFTKRRGDSFLWNHFFRHARNAIQRAAGQHVVRGGEGSGSDGNKGEGGNGGEGGEGGTEASGDSSAAPRPQIASARENNILAAAVSPQHVPSPMLPVNDADFAANVAPSSSSSSLSLSDQRNGITTTAATTEEDTRQALAAVRELTHTVVQFAAGGEAAVSDTTSDSLASTLAILTNVCQRQAQKQSGLQPRLLNQPPSNHRGRPGGDASAASASVAVSDSTPTSESASASGGWVAAGRTLRAGTVDAVLAVEHVAALERILREQRCPDTSRCAAALVGSSATLARVVTQQAQAQAQAQARVVVVVVEEGGGGQGKGEGERQGGGTGGETSKDGGNGGQGGSRSQDGIYAGAGSITAGADTGARCLLSIVPALLSQLQQSEQLPSLSMLQCRRDCVGALGALSALGPDCTLMKLARCAPP
jgi:hypothetical protein